MLADRKLKILKAIIDDYIDTAQPIGSRTIAKKSSIGVSPATIRNEMADLEDLGYLLQPHTSAGRVPSDLGYRIYVDSLIAHEILDSEKQKLIRSLLLNNIIDAEDIVNHATKILSDLTGLTVVTSLPLFKKSKLRNMKLVKVNDTKVLLILVSDSGVVKSINLGIRDIKQFVLDKIADTMLDKFYDTAIDSINVKSFYSIRSELGEYSAVVDYLIPILRDCLKEIEDFEIYVDGINNIFKLPEFNDVGKAKKFLELINNKSLLYDSIKNVNEDDTTIWIGAENRIDELKDLTVISTPYKFNGKQDGRIGIIGPTRMDYEKALSALEFLRDTLSDVFSGIYL